MKINNTSINEKNVGEIVTLYGWVNKKRDLGGLVFIDLRDRSGIIQLVVNPESDVYDLASDLKNEYVIKVTGKVVLRKEANKNLKTGEIEIEVQKLEVLNKSVELPFDLNNTTALEETRLKYRYLDLRRDELKDKLMIKHKVMQSTRSYLNSLDFMEIETPILCKSTPEGARDYLVPSRVNKGCFYALPQSPQLFKQLLMMSGMERYYQIARCFRDEDLRADRQPEFTQIDMEMSFVNEDDVMSITEGLLYNIFKEVKGIEIKLPIDRMTYEKAMNLYGSDKPDLRFENPIYDITDSFKESDFSLFNNIINDGGIINALVFNAADKYSRKDIDKLTEFVKIYQAKALAFLKYKDQEWSGSIAKVLSGEEKESLKTRLEIEEDDTIFIIADTRSIASTALGALRLKLGHELELIDHEKYNFLWVTDFPMFEYSEEEGRYVAAHHPFTSPNKEDIDKLLTDKENCYSRAYDLVLNGYELLSGSVRIHEEELQEKVFEAIGMTHEEAERKFGFFLDAFQYGAPPHCGVGIGLERLIMILVDTDNIRDVIAFPKTASATCLMSEAPNEVDKKQLDELGIEVKKRVKEDL